MELPLAALAPRHPRHPCRGRSEELSHSPRSKARQDPRDNLPGMNLPVQCGPERRPPQTLLTHGAPPARSLSPGGPAQPSLCSGRSPFPTSRSTLPRAHTLVQKCVPEDHFPWQVPETQLKLKQDRKRYQLP